MVYVDYRERPGKREKEDLLAAIRRVGMKAEKTDLEFGDVCFEGNGPRGPLAIGIERKRIHDMLACIEDSRYNGHQRVGMSQLYDKSYLLLEGIWRPHDPRGTLMEGNHQGAWWDSKPGGRYVLYSKLRRYLFSVELSGVHILYTRDLFHSAFDICELFHYYQKKWTDHKAMKQIQKLTLPSLRGKPPLVRRWAEDIEGVGETFGEQAERLFKTPIALATSEALQWRCLPRIGEGLANDIIAQIEGKKR